jgi:hypothetical protein
MPAVRPAVKHRHAIDRQLEYLLFNSSIRMSILAGGFEDLPTARRRRRRRRPT